MKTKTPFSIKTARVSTIFLALIFTLSLSACLKTRAQLKEEGGDQAPEEYTAGKSAPAKIKDLNEGERADKNQDSNDGSIPSGGGYAIDELKVELTKLTGRIEELERSQRERDNESTQKKELEKAQATENRIAELERTQIAVLEALRKVQGSMPVAENIDDFVKGKNLFRAGDYKNAIEHLSLYLKSPSTTNTEEATYLRAEAFFASKEYKKAIVDFSKFPEKYGTSPLMPVVLLRIGQSFEALGMKEDAKGFYQELLEKFPKSNEAKKVKTSSSKKAHSKAP